ncbi:MAG: hypothetical protein AAB456_03400 [Patescibacteria group bacterium]
MDPKESLTIAQAYDEGLAANPVQPDGGSPNSPDGSKGDGHHGDNNPPKDQNNGGQPNSPAPDSKKNDGAQGDGKNIPDPKKPDINPDDGKYVGEYNKERFDGLMSAWQKDRQLAREIPTLKKEIETLKDRLDGTPPGKPDKDADIDEELPPELRGADAETQAGFRLLMKASEGKLSKLEENIVNKIMDTLHKPVRDEAELVTKVRQEVEDLSVELGKDFSDNIGAIKKFAAENNYPLGTLRHAFKAWSQDNKIAQLEGRKKDGKKTLEEIEKEKAEKAGLPSGSANRSGETPKWDEKRDGNKDLSDIFEDVKAYL